MKTNLQAVSVNGSNLVWTGLLAAVATMFLQSGLAAAQAPVDLGTAGNFAILTKSGVSTVPPSAITGDIGVSPIDSTSITGFSLSMDSSGQFSTTPQVTGKVYAPDYAVPTPSNLTTAIGDMQTAYTEAAGRSIPDFTELGSGEIGGQTLVPGLYKWSSDVLISSDVTLNGGPDDVWIFQIAGKITQESSTKVFLSGGAQAKNIFWQAFGNVTIGTAAHFEGIILTQTSISLMTGASMNGRLLAQTAVTLDANDVTSPAAADAYRLESSVTLTDPWVFAIGQSNDLDTKTMRVPMSGSKQFYRIRSATSLAITSITISGGVVVISYNNN